MEIVTLEKLRTDHPRWSWRAVRHGFGWRYEGRHEGSMVTLAAHAKLCGPREDDYCTEWIVVETGESYTTWRFRKWHGE